MRQVAHPEALGFNYSLPEGFWQVTQRNIIRSWWHQELWNSCYKTSQRGVLSRDSIILWTLGTYRKNRCSLSKLLTMPQYPSLPPVELRSPAETQAWQRSLPAILPLKAPETTEQNYPS